MQISDEARIMSENAARAIHTEILRGEEASFKNIKHAVDCIIEAAVMEVVEKTKKHSHPHIHSDAANCKVWADQWGKGVSL